MRVRDEFKRQLESYKTLYESSIAYGMRKMIDSEQYRTQMNTKISMLERECAELQKYVEEQEQKITLTKQFENEKLQSENQAHQKEVEKIRDMNNKIKEEL